MVALWLAALTGCSSSPVALGTTSIPPPPDSVRYVNLEGWPGAYATVWSHGVINVAAGFSYLAERRLPYRHCVINGTGAWRGTFFNGDSLAGFLSGSYSPDDSTRFVGGSMIGLRVHPDTLYVEVIIRAETPCGSFPIMLPLYLVKEAL